MEYNVIYFHRRVLPFWDTEFILSHWHNAVCLKRVERDPVVPTLSTNLAEIV